MSFKRILVPYDGLSCSKRAFKLALEFAQIFNSELIILECIDMFVANWFVRSSFEDIVLKKLRGKIMNEIKILEKISKKKNISITGKIQETSSIANTIVTFSKNKNIDLIVMGAKGSSSLGSFFLGSVSNDVIHKAKCPVLIIK
jgi:nucleotide-binding universal stress UspA family protein